MQIWSAEIKELESLYTSIKGKFPEFKKDLEYLIFMKGLLNLTRTRVLNYSGICHKVFILNLL
jgi:hypothetical protein